MQGRRILIIEDDPCLARMVGQVLRDQGVECRSESSAAAGVQAAIEYRPALVLLDLGLPDQSGLETLKKLREWYRPPILILTARESDDEKVAALDGGADDYITKPFSTVELLARIRVALRNFDRTETRDQHRIGPYEIDLSARSIQVEGNPVRLTATEFDILRVLLRYQGKVVTHRVLLNEVWGPNAVEHYQYVRVYVAQLRKKLRLRAGLPSLIQTDLGVGYRLGVTDP